MHHLHSIALLQQVFAKNIIQKNGKEIYRLEQSKALITRISPQESVMVPIHFDNQE